jgi:hypothetical protein
MMNVDQNYNPLNSLEWNNHPLTNPNPISQLTISHDDHKQSSSQLYPLPSSLYPSITPAQPSDVSLNKHKTTIISKKEINTAINEVRKKTT